MSLNVCKLSPLLSFCIFLEFKNDNHSILHFEWYKWLTFQEGERLDNPVADQLTENTRVRIITLALYYNHYL